MFHAAVILRFGGRTRWSVFSVCPYRKHFGISRAVSCSHEQYHETKRDLPQSTRLCSKCKGLFTVVIIDLLSIWFWPYLPSYSSLSNLPINIGSLTVQVCAWPLSSVVRRHLCATFWPFPYLFCLCCIFLSLCAGKCEVQWCFRKYSVPQNVPDGVYSVWS